MCTAALVVLVVRECTLIFFVILLFCNLRRRKVFTEMFFPPVTLWRHFRVSTVGGGGGDNL